MGDFLQVWPPWVWELGWNTALLSSQFAAACLSPLPKTYISTLIAVDQDQTPTKHWLTSPIGKGNVSRFQHLMIFPSSLSSWSDAQSQAGNSARIALASPITPLMGQPHTTSYLAQQAASEQNPWLDNQPNIPHCFAYNSIQRRKHNYL